MLEEEEVDTEVMKMSQVEILEVEEVKAMEKNQKEFNIMKVLAKL